MLDQCNGKRECALLNPCVDTSRYTEIGMDCLPNPCFQSPCENGGICHIGRHGAECECPLGLRGKFCELRHVVQDLRPVNPCLQNPCANGGQCVYLADQDYICQCPQGILSVLTNFILNNGICKTTITYRYIYSYTY